MKASKPEISPDGALRLARQAALFVLPRSTDDIIIGTSGQLPHETTGKIKILSWFS
jgi:hypothetical protein